MSKYTSKPVVVNKTPEELYDRFSNFDNLGQYIGNLPAEVKDKVGNMRFTKDAIVLVTPQVGEIEFALKDKVRPSRLVLEARHSPVPLEMTVNFTPAGDAASEVTAAIDVDIPMMLKPLVGPKLQEAADKFGEIIGGLG